MKINSLLYRTKFVLESDDDMFPGLDSSAFDSKKKDAQDTPDNTKELQSEFERTKETAKSYDNARRKLLDYLVQNEAFIYDGGIFSGGKSKFGPNEVDYRAFDWIKKYVHARELLEGYGISKKSPIFNNIEKQVRALDNYEERFEYYNDRVNGLWRKIQASERGREHT